MFYTQTSPVGYAGQSSNWIRGMSSAIAKGFTEWSFGGWRVSFLSLDRGVGGAVQENFCKENFRVTLIHLSVAHMQLNYPM